MINKIKDSLEKNGKYWIAFVGDSITQCYSVHPNWREMVEYVLQEELAVLLDSWSVPEWGIRGFNFGYDGASTQDILNKIDLIKKVEPDLVIALMGGNDPIFKITPEKHLENIKTIIGKLGTKVVWCTSTPSIEGSKKNEEYEPYANKVMGLEENSNLQFIDVFNIYKTFPLQRIFTFKSEEIKSEGIKEGDPDLEHPNQLGNAYIAKIILKQVFEIDFDPEKYIKTTIEGYKYPEY